MSGPPTLQGKSSATWLCPPLDGSLTVPEIFEYHARNSPKHPLFVYPDNRTGSRTILYPEALRAFRRAAKIASGHYQAFREKHGRATASTIGILAVAGKSTAILPDLLIIVSALTPSLDSISYFSSMVGIMQLGLTAFPISTRNSAVGVAHLIRTTGVQQVFVSPDSAMQRLSQEAIDVLAKDGVSVELLPFPQFSDLYDGSSSDEPEVVPLDNLSKDATALILHSSGSTAFPKSIKVSHLNFLQWGKALPNVDYGEVDICGNVIAAHALPMFHGMGATVMTWAACSGAVMGCFPPSSPPVLPNPDNFLEAIVDTNSDLVSCVPAHVEAANLPILQKLMGIVFGGAPLNKEIGDALSRAGVKLPPFYGATEIGNVILSVPDLENETEWEYFRFSPHLRVEILLQEDTTDIFEPVILSSPPYTPNVINTEINGILGYRTNDLVQRHPVRDDYYQIYGRLDDQLMLSTGEKTNPVPLETIMLQDPHIVAALMFGRGRFQNGVIIQPKDEFDPNDTEELAEFRKVIWPTIERVNEYAPSHSRIFKEMIIVTSPAKSFEYTPKGTPRRQVCIDAYSDEIDAAYTAVKTSSQTELEPPASWMPELISEFVRAAVRQVMKEPVRDEDDLFQHGCDSLQATSIRNTILRALRSSSRVSTHDIPSTFVYTHPSIRALSDFISGLFSKTGAARGSPTTRESRAQEMRELVQKYSRNFVRAAHQPEMNGTGETILLTGTTGRLGCHLLATLLSKPDVHRIFALNRHLSHVDLEERQRQAFAMWGLDLGLLSSSKMTLLVSDLAKKGFGLDQDVYEQIQRSVTIIIHNAWRVDFNFSLASFEPLILGVRHLIDLSLSATCLDGARFIFTSSVAVLRSKPINRVVIFKF
ncbi:hypothetical protein EWM64_g5737 [Hericium alpestre]|uniref:Polyketide synthase-like phosphopantetheine-binding domain-containing protein n=1 Tax=Hericium alpestre TaxID=135208 RepID=A0A4Y9ZW38_9AGAM|nr:hypothetical protein EWM64_g5737 [Hericium alpestre]